MARLEEIKRKLAELRRLDSRLQLWGATNHGYRLHAPITRRELTRYEDRYSVEFPESYAAFLLELGNGGAGPGVGLYTLSEAIGKFEKKGDWLDERHYVRPRLNAPFPANSMLAEVMCKIQEQPSDDIYERLRRPRVYMHHNVDGVLEVSNEGCCYLCLVITGDQRGNVWSHGDNNDWLPAGRDSNQIGFLDWYESWLDGWLRPGAYEKWAQLTQGI